MSAGDTEPSDRGESRGAGDDFWATLPLGRGVTLVTRDANGVAALCKPAGILSHPNRVGGEKGAKGEPRRSLLCAPYDLREECYDLGMSAQEGRGANYSESGLTDTGQRARANKKRPRLLYLLNRLDSATSGLLLVCADRELARTIRQRFRERAVHKTYVALVFGSPKQIPRCEGYAALWRDKLSIEKRGGQIRTRAVASERVRRPASGGVVTAETRVRVLWTRGDLSLLELVPVTGRSHQLRVQCARRGLPIVGDATYGDFAANRAFAKAHSSATRGRLYLHSLETRFDYEWHGQKNHFAAHAPLPEAFEQLVHYLT